MNRTCKAREKTQILISVQDWKIKKLYFVCKNRYKYFLKIIFGPLMKIMIKVASLMKLEAILKKNLDCNSQ